jgi:DNA-binding XRE family transcriptional regulator
MIFTPYVSEAIMDSMCRNVNGVMRALNSEQRRRIQARAAELIADEMTLQQLRLARKLTQVRVAKALGITQDSVSRLEKRSDILLSALRKTAQVMGGNLSLVAEFPDRAPVVLTGIGEAESDAKPSVASTRVHDG